MSQQLKHTISVGGKLYGYWTVGGVVTQGIRSESNPDKTPYLKHGSKQYEIVSAAIAKATGAKL